jgi:hypothetical protein
MYFPTLGVTRFSMAMELTFLTQFTESCNQQSIFEPIDINISNVLDMGRKASKGQRSRECKSLRGRILNADDRSEVGDFLSCSFTF